MMYLAENRVWDERVADFFHNLRLEIQNLHFLIKLTKLF